MALHLPKSIFHPFAALRSGLAGLLARSLYGSGEIPALDFVRGLDTSSSISTGLTQPYAQSVWVQRALKRISGPIIAVPLVLDPDRDDLRAFWRAPAQRLNFAELIEASIGWLKLAGEFFWLLDDSWLIGAAGRAPLILARPDRMYEVVSGGELIGWIYISSDGRRHRLLPEQVVHIRDWNPYSEWRGLSELCPAMTAAEADYLQARFARHIAASNGDTGPMVIAKGAFPTVEQREMIVRELKAKRAANQRGDFRPIFLAGDLQIEDSKIRAPDASFVAQRLANRHEIFLAFGVPASMADVQASYSIGSASDRFLLIEETCKPVSEKIARAIEVVSAKIINQPVTAYFDWDEHSTMQAVRRERIDTALKLWSAGMPLSLVSEYLDLDLPEFPGWDSSYLPMGVTPAEALTAAPENLPELNENQPANSGAASLDPATQIIRALRARKEQRVCDCGCTLDALRAARPEWRAQMIRRRAWAKKFQSRINLNLMRARAEVLEKLSRATQGQLAAKPNLTRAVAAEFMFDLSGLKKSLQVSLKPLWQAALDDAGKGVVSEVGKEPNAFKMPPDYLFGFLKNRENKISGAADEIFGQIKGALEDGIEKGETIDELSDRVRDAFNNISRSRSMMIAITETNTAFGQGRDLGMKQAGIKFKKWLTSGADNVRPSHRELDGMVVPIDEEFPNGCKFPGDPDGPAKEVINCHCTHIPVSDEEGQSSIEDQEE